MIGNYVEGEVHKIRKVNRGNANKLKTKLFEMIFNSYPPKFQKELKV